QQFIRLLLKDDLGADFELALKLEASGEVSDEPWLADCHEKEPVKLGRAPLSGRIEAMHRNQDVAGLLAELTCEDHPNHRIQAAQALVEIDRLEYTTLLLNVVLRDPDAQVQQSVRELLQKEVLGSSFETALKVEASGEISDEPWLKKCHASVESLPVEDLPSEDFNPVTAEDVREMHGMLAILRGETNPDLRIRAIQALKHLPEIGVVQSLAEVALSEPDERVRRAARAALQESFGDDVDDLLDTYRLPEDEDEELEVAGDELETPRVGDGSAPSVIREEKQPVWLWLALGIVVVILAYLLLRGG
ncbi:MAG: HEAT repeat domain-containing protein, partial [Anaerolineaceae bacterium]